MWDNKAGSVFQSITFEYFFCENASFLIKARLSLWKKDFKIFLSVFPFYFLMLFWNQQQIK